MSNCVHGLPDYCCALCNGIRRDKVEFRPRKRDEVFLTLPRSNNPNVRLAAASGSRRGTWEPKSKWAAQSVNHDRDKTRELLEATSRARVRSILREW